jgi:S1-C subfamily serine protease
MAFLTKPFSQSRGLWLSIVGLLALLSLSVTLDAQAQQGAFSFDLERIQRATAFIIQARDTGDTLEITCVGTGTIVNRNGLILTNAHNTVQSTSCPGEIIVIALSVRLDEPPIPKYRAEVVQVDAGADLALLRITRQIDGRLIDSNTLGLPSVELADSSNVQLDDTITIVGYPGIGYDPIANVRGTVSAFVSEPSGGTRSWIKTSAAISGTMSGGGAYNANGQLIGIPTTAPVTTQAANLSCVWDTNNDGIVNTNDTCIPIGDSINALRPSNFARPLLRAASLGISVQTRMNFGTALPPTSAPTFRRLFFSPSVNDAGMPTTVLRSLPAGSNSLYLFFDYANMTPETVYSLRVTTDGIPNSTFSLAPVRWSGGERGLWYFGSSSQPWPNGVYEFTLFANGIATESQRLIVGGGATVEPAFSDISFGLLDLQGNVLGNGFVLPTGNVASAEFLYRDVVEGTPWSAVWYYEGEEFFRTPDDQVWLDGPTGRKAVSISEPNGLLPGNYRLELYLNSRLAATSDFIIAGAQEGVFPRIFDNAHFTTAASLNEARTSPAISNFAAGTQSIYALFNWQQLGSGTNWTMRWSVDGEIFSTQTGPWFGPESGSNYTIEVGAPGGVPDGTYRMELFVGRLPLAQIESRVGIGQLPLDPFAGTQGAQLRGTIIDAETGEGIPGASFILISDQFSVQDFTWTEEQIYASSISDQNGQFEIDRLLQFSTDARSVPYSAIIVAQGYVPLSADGLVVRAGEQNPIDITIEMLKD